MQELDYITPFTFFIRDKGWLKKFAIASLLTYTIIGITPTLGWLLAILRGVVRGQENLPDWSDFWGLWKAGFKYWLVNLVWLQPVFLTLLGLYLPLLFANSMDTALLLGILLGGMGCVLLFISVYAALIIFLAPALMGLLAENAPLRMAINPLKAWRLARSHFYGHLMVFLVVGMGLTTVISLLAPLTLFLLLPPMMVYAGMVTAHFAGQLYRHEV